MCSEVIWRKAVIGITATVREAARNLNEVGIKLCLIIDDKDRLLGTISDGDIRRALLRGLDLSTPAHQIMQPHPLVVPPNISSDVVMQLMLSNKVQQIPVLDDKSTLVGLHLWEEFFSHNAIHENILVVMAGGFGVRMRPHTENCPKPMLLVSGKPILHHIIDNAKSDGFINFIFAIHYLGDSIEEYFGDGTKFGVRIRYLREISPLGTAGALSLLSQNPEKPILVANGDVISDIRYSEILSFHVRHNAIASMAVKIHELVNPFGVVSMRGIDIIGFEEKPVTRAHVNAGIYVLEPIALQYLRNDEHCDMPTLFQRLQRDNKKIIAFPMHEPWLDIGRPDDLRVANLNKKKV